MLFGAVSIPEGNSEAALTTLPPPHPLPPRPRLEVTLLSTRGGAYFRHDASKCTPLPPLFAFPSSVTIDASSPHCVRPLFQTRSVSLLILLCPYAYAELRYGCAYICISAPFCRQPPPPHPPPPSTNTPRSANTPPNSLPMNLFMFEHSHWLLNSSHRFLLRREVARQFVKGVEIDHLNI